MAKKKLTQTQKEVLKKNSFKNKPENRNTTGLNKGHKWGKKILAEIIQQNLTVKQIRAIIKGDEGIQQLLGIFKGKGDNININELLQYKQVLLALSNNPRISQNALTAIADRLEGKPNTTEQTEENKEVKLTIKQYKNKTDE